MLIQVGVTAPKGQFGLGRLVSKVDLRLQCGMPCSKLEVSTAQHGTLSGAGYLHQSRHECGPEWSREFIGRHAQLLSRTEERPLVAPLSRFRLRQLSSVLRAFVARREGRRRVDLTRSPHRFWHHRYLRIRPKARVDSRKSLSPSTH